ncbi:hypothetical protein ACFRAO_42780 [Streptomyces sp. NPDC056656]|uniref:hypothetical protein n=1 Tax=Streptomyces sp. NPDC056656 TaxID=3345895 RepID=UPI0036973498
MIVPTPYPLTSFLLTAQPSTARSATGDRALELSLVLESWEASLVSHFELSDHACRIADRLLNRSSLRVALPPRRRSALPDWVLPALHGTRVVAQGIPWASARELLPRGEPVYCAEARRRGAQPVTDTVRAILDFPLSVSVLGHRSLYGLDEASDPELGAPARQAPTVVALDAEGTLTLLASGAHDHHVGDKRRFVSELHAWCVGARGGIRRERDPAPAAPAGQTRMTRGPRAL